MIRKKKIYQMVARASDETIKVGVARLARRIEELRQLDVTTLSWDDKIFEILEQNIRDTIAGVFGPLSVQAERYASFSIIDRTTFLFTNSDQRPERIRGYVAGAIQVLQGLINILEDGLLRSSLAKRTIAQNIQLHPAILNASTSLLESGHYSQAVFEAAKALIAEVKKKSGRTDLDGASLVRQVFSRNDPILKFNEFGTQSEKDEQEGLMHCFEGAALAIRNPRGHESLRDTPQEALEQLSRSDGIRRDAVGHEEPGSPDGPCGKGF